MFDFEWTGRSFGDETDSKRGIEAAQEFCQKRGYNPAYLANQIATDDEDEEARTLWGEIEHVATQALCEGWHQPVENVSLIWR